METVKTGFQELLVLLEEQGITVDVAFIKDEYDDVIERWGILSEATQEHLKATRKEKQSQVMEDVSSIEEAIVEAQVVETEAEPVDWNVLLSDPSYAARIDVRSSDCICNLKSRSFLYA